MTKLTDRVVRVLADLRQASPNGYAVAADIEFTTPTFLFQTYVKEWLDEYTAEGLVMRDPTVAWGFENEGTKCWSELQKVDAGFFDHAARHGIRYGFTVSRHSEPLRAIASFSREDRKFTDQEVREIEVQYTTLLNLLRLAKDDFPDEVEKIIKLSQALTH